MNEVFEAYTWIYDTLSSNATVAGLVSDRIYAGSAPQGAALPFVIFNHMGGVDLIGVGTARVWNNSLYQVKGVTPGRSHATGQQLANAIDAALHGHNGSTTGGLVIGCVREQPIVYGQSDNGEEFRHAGGIYRIYAEEI